MNKIILTICTSFFSSFLWADGTWECANSITEVACVGKNNCQATQQRQNTFRISIKNNTQVSVCAENNCWQGQVQPTTSSNQKLYPIKEFGWTTLDKQGGNYVLGVSSDNKELYLKGNNRTYQMQCSLV